MSSCSSRRTARSTSTSALTPGADGLYSKPASQTPGFVQPIVNTDGTIGTISPFKIPLTVTDVNGKTVPIYPQDTDSVNHSHAGYETKIDVQNGVTLNDGYAITEEGVTITNGVPSAKPSLAKKQTGELVMGHVDCDAAPILWNYADRFTLFDNFHQTVLSASTPNAIAMIAGQSGETQWVKHPEESTKNFAAAGGTPNKRWHQRCSRGFRRRPVLGFAAGHLRQRSAGQSAVQQSADQPYLRHPAALLHGLGHLQHDRQRHPAKPGSLRRREGHRGDRRQRRPSPPTGAGTSRAYDLEFNDTTGTASHSGYIPSPQRSPSTSAMFRTTRRSRPHLHGLSDFAIDMQNQNLPKDGGVFYVRGGYGNLLNLKPVDPNPALATVFNGDDDHPGYSDLQISSALVAAEVDLITSSPYWFAERHHHHL